MQGATEEERLVQERQRLDDAILATQRSRLCQLIENFRFCLSSRMMERWWISCERASSSIDPSLRPYAKTSVWKSIRSSSTCTSHTGIDLFSEN